MRTHDGQATSPLQPGEAPDRNNFALSLTGNHSQLVVADAADIHNHPLPHQTLIGKEAATPFLTRADETECSFGTSKFVN